MPVLVRRNQLICRIIGLLIKPIQTYIYGRKDSRIELSIQSILFYPIRLTSIITHFLRKLALLPTQLTSIPSLLPLLLCFHLSQNYYQSIYLIVLIEALQAIRLLGFKILQIISPLQLTRIPLAILSYSFLDFPGLLQ